jgi:hypothetical protein
VDEKTLRYLEATLDAVEHQFVTLVSRQKLFAENGDSAAGRLLGQLRHLLEGVVELEGRRDATYPDLHRVQTLKARVVWLYRRLAQERLFTRKLQLEERLRSLMSPEAYDVYLELQACEVEEEADRAATDEELVARLLS